MSFSSSRAGRLPPFPGRRLFSVHPERNLNLNGRSWSFIVGRGDTAEVRDGATGTKKREKDRPRPGGREGERSRVYKCVYMLERERARVEGEEERREGEKRARERERERERREQPPMEHTVLPCLELGSGFGLVLVLGLGLRRPRRDFGSNPGEKGLDIELSN